MSTVVERGLARCPRCVAIADYVFIETSDRLARGLRYEVRCRKCGESYGEDSGPSAAQTVVVRDILNWPPDRLPVPPRDWGNEVRERWSVAAERSKCEFDELSRRAYGAYELSRTWVQERRAARLLNQTGGYAGGG